MPECTADTGAIHKDLLALISEMDAELLAVEPVTRLPSLESLRASYRLTFTGGLTLKGRVLDTSERVNRISQLHPLLDDAVFPALRAARGHAVLEEWVPDAAPVNEEGARELCYRAGEILGSIHTTTVPERCGAEIRLAPDDSVQRLRDALRFLRDTNLLSVSAVRDLETHAQLNAPQTLDAGLVHLDFCAENMVESSAGLLVVDNELVDLGALDMDLARTWYRWPNLDRQAFMRGYELSRDLTPFLHHQTFWAVFVLVRAAAYRHRVGYDPGKMIESLQALSRGKPPQPWRHFHTRGFPSSRLKVGFCCDYLATGGQEQMCFNMVQALDKTLFEPRVYAFRGGAVATKIEALGVPVKLASMADPLSWQRGWTEQDAREKADYQRLLKEWVVQDGVDVLIAFACPEAVDAANASKVSALIEKLDGPYMLDRISDKSAFDVVVAESREIEDLVRSRASDFSTSDDRITRVYPGVDLEAFSPERFCASTERARLGFSAGDFVVGFVGRLSPEKNVGLLLDALASLPAEIAGRAIKLFIAGPDEGEKAALENKIAALQLNDRVVLQGEPDEVARVMSAFDVFTIVSLTEGLPTALLEAMAMGLPIVATNVGSIAEVLHGNGLLVRSNDALALAASLQALAADPGQCEMYALKGRRSARAFSLRSNIVHYERIILSTIRRRGTLAQLAVLGAHKTMNLEDE
ncbi:MAG: glycosyltransferase [Pseudomonadota bacterium]